MRSALLRNTGLRQPGTGHLNIFVFLPNTITPSLNDMLGLSPILDLLLPDMVDELFGFYLEDYYGFE
jgi:hypothetical protein